MIWNGSSLATFLSLTAKAHVYPVTYGQLRNTQHSPRTSRVQSVKCTFTLYREFKVIQGHLYWRRQKSRTLCRRNAINADNIFETYEDIATEKRQIRRLQRPPWFKDAPARNAFDYLQTTYIARN